MGSLLNHVKTHLAIIKRLGFYLLVASAGFSLLMNIGASVSHAAWVEVPFVNPGAETGDTLGWQGVHSEVATPLVAVNDPSQADSGDWYFSINEYYASFGMYRQYLRQGVDLSAYAGRIDNLEFWARTSYDQEQIWGQSEITGADELYNWGAILQVTAYDSQNNFLGFFSSIPWFEPDSPDQWHWIGAQALYSDFEDYKNVLDHIEVELLFGFSSDYEVNVWPILDDWVDGAPQFGRYDSVSVWVDAVPIPGAVWLLGSGLLGIFGIRRKLNK